MKKSKLPRDQVLVEASSAINGSRQTNYGNPEDNFLRIARVWNAYLKNIGIVKPGDRILSNADTAAMMILMKTGRLANSIDHKESWVDIAGYAACGFESSQKLDSE